MTVEDGAAIADLSDKSEEFKKIVELYAKLWVQTNKSVSIKSWDRFRDAFEAAEDGFDSPSVYGEMGNILGPMRKEDIVGRGCTSRTMADWIDTAVSKRWIQLILGIGEDAPRNLREMAIAYHHKEQTDGWKFLEKLHGKKAKKQCLTVLKNNQLVGDDLGIESLDRFPPFNNFYGIDLTWREYSNIVEHVLESKEGHAPSSEKREQLLERFFNQNIGTFDKIGEKHLQKSVKLCIDFLYPGSGKYLFAMMPEATKRFKVEFARSDFLRERLDVIQWQKWVNPYIHPDSPMNELCAWMNKSAIVEIRGWGGIGKTHLARHFIKLSIDGKAKEIEWDGNEIPVEQFEAIEFIHSKKSKEWAGLLSGTGNPLDPGYSFGYRNEDADFSSFIERILIHESEEGLGDREARARKVLEEKRILVVIDNYEDVTRVKSTFQKYQKFLLKIRGTNVTRSRILITGREPNQENTPGAQSFELTGFKPVRRTDLLITSFFKKVELRQDRRNDFEFHPKVVELFTGDRKLVSSFIEKVIKEMGDQFEEDVGKPHNIFEFVNAIGRESVKKDFQFSERDSFLKLLSRAAKSDELKKALKSNREKSVEDAFNEIWKHEDCQNLLRVLWSSPTPMTIEEIRAQSDEEGRAIPGEGVRKSLARIRSYEDLIQEVTDIHSKDRTAYKLPHLSRYKLGELQADLNASVIDFGLIRSTRESVQRISDELEKNSMSGLSKSIDRLRDEEDDIDLKLKVSKDDLVGICTFLDIEYAKSTVEQMRVAIKQSSRELPINSQNLYLCYEIREDLLDLGRKDVEDLGGDRIEWFSEWAEKQFLMAISDPDRIEEGGKQRSLEYGISIISKFIERGREREAREFLKSGSRFILGNIDTQIMSDNLWADRLAKIVYSELMIPKSEEGEDKEYVEFWIKAVVKLDFCDRGIFKEQRAEAVFERIVEITEESEESKDQSSDSYTGGFIRKNASTFTRDEYRRRVGIVLSEMTGDTRNYTLNDLVEGTHEQCLFHVIDSDRIPSDGEYGFEWEIENLKTIEGIRSRHEGIETYRWILLKIGTKENSEGDDVHCFTLFLNDVVSTGEEAGEDKGELAKLVDWINRKLMENEGQWLAVQWLEEQWRSEKARLGERVYSTLDNDSFGRLIDEQVRTEIKSGILLSKADPNGVKTQFCIAAPGSSPVAQEQRDTIGEMIRAWWHEERSFPKDHETAAKILMRISELIKDSDFEKPWENSSGGSVGKRIGDGQAMIRDLLVKEFPEVNPSYIWWSSKPAIQRLVQKQMSSKAEMILRDNVNHNLKAHGTDLVRLDEDALNTYVYNWRESVAQYFDEENLMIRPSATWMSTSRRKQPRRGNSRRIGVARKGPRSARR